MTTLSWPEQKPWFTVILGYGSDVCLTVHVRATSQYDAISQATKYLRVERVPDHEIDLLETYAVFLGHQVNLVQSDTPNLEDYRR